MLNLKTKIAKVPLSCNNGQFLCFIYHGLSMLPTFKPGQYLYIKKEAHNLSIGDVIIYKNYAGKGYTVHRVVSIIDSKVLTRGDNNSTIDKQTIDFKSIIGRIEAVVDNGQKIKFGTDKLKLLRVRIKWFFFDIQILLKKPLRPIYKFLRYLLIISRIPKVLFSKKIKKIIFKSQGGEVVKFLFKGNTVAQWLPEQDRFFCKKPFDLLISKPDNRSYKTK